MASTNRTTNYDLSQYVGSDKPTYLGDYNSDMLKIDTQMKANHDLATSANATATTANETAGTALTNAGTAQRTADGANETATSALAKATTNEANINKLNLTSFNRYTSSDMVITNGSLNQVSNITVATNSDGSIGKIYGSIIATALRDGFISVTIQQTNLRPTENITISGGVISQVTSDKAIYLNDITINTNGNITFSISGIANTITKTLAINSLLFMSNFGDTPQE